MAQDLEITSETPINAYDMSLDNCTSPTPSSQRHSTSDPARPFAEIRPHLHLQIPSTPARDGFFLPDSDMSTSLADGSTLHLEAPSAVSRLRHAATRFPPVSHHPSLLQARLSTASTDSMQGHLAREPTHTNSRVWVNPRQAELERWHQVEANLKRMELIPRSPFVPHTFSEWIAHRRGRAEDAMAEEAQKLADMEASSLPGRSRGGHVRIGPAFGGKVWNDGRSAVLAMPTVWSSWYEPNEQRPQALWPCGEEMREEGDERKTSGFRRFPGLPRVPGNETVAWKQKNALPSLPFDAVWQLPTAESVAAAAVTAAAVEIERMEELLGRDLLDAIDCKTNDAY